MQNEIVLNASVLESLHKRFAMALERKSAGAIRQVSTFLSRLERSGASYASCLHLLEMELRRTVAEAGVESGTDESRRRKAYAQEAFHLVRRELRELRGYPVSKAESFSFGRRTYALAAHIDGSLRHGRAAVGVLLSTGTRDLVTVAMPVKAANSAEAEMQALLVAMKTTLALGRRSLRVFTDAESLIALLKGQSRLRFTQLGRDILSLVPAFSGLAVVVVPRIYNHRADHLALERTRLPH